MTLPDSPWGTFNDVSRTSRAFSPKIGRRAVGEKVAFLHLLALDHARLLVDAGVLVRTAELRQPVPGGLAGAAVVDGDRVAGDLGDETVGGGLDHVGRVAGGAGLDAG